MPAFEFSPEELRERLEEIVDETFGDLQSQFLVLPRGGSCIDYPGFQDAYEVLRRNTDGFSYLTEDAVWTALREDSLVLVVLRTILGVSPAEWADIARSELGSDVSQGYVRNLDVKVRQDRDLFSRWLSSAENVGLKRAKALISVAVGYVMRGAPEASEKETVHRLAKVDTHHGIASLAHVAAHDVPYAMLLYERYLGRPFASHRDSVSELVGDVMENAIEERLDRSEIAFDRTRRAERVPGFEQAPDFFVPNKTAPAVIIEAKITGDDGTARDKVSRILRLANMRDSKIRNGQPGFEVVACIDGRGFGVRRQDMRDMLLATGGKVFTLATLDQLVRYTRLREFLPRLD
jgi:hypothetical protein